jgi:hypothetical protein
MRSTVAAMLPASGRVRPMPNRASMTNCQWRLGNLSSVRTTVTLQPCSERMRAATKPSPPLLPGPATIRMGPLLLPSIARAAAAIAAPARSISGGCASANLASMARMPAVWKRAAGWFMAALYAAAVQACACVC